MKELLVDPGYVDEDDFDLVAKIADNKSAPLDRLLVEKGMIKDESLGRLIADEAGYPFISLKKANLKKIDNNLLKIIPEVVAHSQRAIAFEETDDAVKVATSRPDDYPFFKMLEKKAEKSVEVFYASSFDVDRALKKYRGDLKEEINALIEKLKESAAGAEENVIELVDLILEYAQNNMASDIHIEPFPDSGVVRFRVDGILHKVVEYPKNLHSRIVARLKILAKLRTDEKEAAQDGRFEFGRMDVRTSIMPTTEGENVVLRLLMQQGKRFTIEDLGLSDDDLRKMKDASQKPYGMIVTVGPTGSGKTTTLYALLQMMNRPDVNIMTIEDPTEYNIEGVRQTQVNPAKNITFPKGLRSIVRQDPDIIMVGEIRDEETVDIALNSAMTGHLVLSTMHANDSATAFPRLLEMGAKAFLVASSLNVAIAQRLVRTICGECKKRYRLSGEELEILRQDENLVEIIKKVSNHQNIADINFYKGSGCKFCNNSGYEGRTAIFEVLEITEEIRNLIVKKVSSDIIRKAAIEEGMTTMVHDGVVKSLKGVTTLEEVKKVAKA